MDDINNKITINDVSKMKLVELKKICKTYIPTKYYSSLNKKELLEIIISNLIDINLKIKEIMLFNNLVTNINEDTLTNPNNMNAIFDQYYLFSGMAQCFKGRFLNSISSCLDFDTIIFKTKDLDYRIVAICNKCSYEPSFKDHGFQLFTYGRKGKLLEIDYEGDLGLRIDKDKGILYINAIIVDYYFDRDAYGIETLITTKNKESHTYKEVETFVKEKDRFKPIKEKPSLYSVSNEGCI